MAPSILPSARSATDNDVPSLVALWEACGLKRPHNHAPTDIAFARQGPNSDVIILDDGDKIVAATIVGHDGHRGWVYYVAVAPDHQRCGLGRHMMQEAERWLLARGIWKLQLMVRRSNQDVHRFYETLGFSDDDVRVLSKRLKPMPYIDSNAPS